MTLDEATAHVGHLVLIRTAPGRVLGAEITGVDEARGMVKLRVRRRRVPYDFLSAEQWWHPVHLSVPQWWTDRQKRPMERTTP